MPADQVAERRPRLADRLVEDVRGKIVSGALASGARLPTEVRLAEQYGVSRTVVREAVARLSADGLVNARQGAGVFVTEETPGALAHLASETANKVALVLNVLEVRMAIEIEAAAIAAQRRSPSQLADINRSLVEFDQQLAAGQPTGAPDFAFHRAIATATNNPFYVEILDVLGRRTIPRDLVTTMSSALVQSQEYQTRLQREHRDIMDAIADGDSAAARDAMRHHLSASQRRYQALLREGTDLNSLFAAPGRDPS